MRVRDGTFRESALLLRDRGEARRQDRLWPGADVVVEVVSAPARTGIRRTRPADYAEAGMAEHRIATGSRTRATTRSRCRR